MANGKAWTASQIKEWAENITPERVYEQDVLKKIRALPASLYNVQQYGELTLDPERYPVFRVIMGDLTNGKPNILITAGVHGYEPSGVMAALQFLEKDAPLLTREFNIVVFPCLVPWAYEMNHRLNHLGLDPNRNFFKKTPTSGMPAEECTAFIDSIEDLKVQFSFSVDLHETPLRDIPLLQECSEMHGTEISANGQDIPNGFHVILNSENKNPALGKSIIKSVRAITKIVEGKTITGHSNDNDGVLYLGSHGTLTNYINNNLSGNPQKGSIAVTTEVFPDYKPDKENINAQIAAIYGGLNHLRFGQ